MGMSVTIPASVERVADSRPLKPSSLSTLFPSPSTFELPLPSSIRREMIGFFSVEELLALEEADASWRHTLRDAGYWTTFSLRHDTDTLKNDALLRRVALAHGADVKRLEVVNCAFSSQVAEEVGACFSRLEALVVSGCKMLTDDAFTALVSASQQSLTEIRAVKCPLLTDAALSSVAAFQAQSIERVDFSHCRLLSTAGIAALAGSCQKLREISLKGCPQANDAAVVAIATSCATNLRELCVGGGGNVGDSALQALAANCRELEALDIARSNPFGNGRGGVSDLALLGFVAKCGGDLQRLVLRGQGQLSLAVLASVSAHCPKLQSLDIGGCRQIIQDPVALCAELQRMALLEQLSVSFARGLSDQHISSIATQCPQLKRFDVDGSPVAVVSIQSAEKAFDNIFAITVLPFPSFSELQMLHLKAGLRTKLFTATSVSSSTRLMVAIHEKLALSTSERAQQLNVQMDSQLLTHAHALSVLRTNFPSLSADECEMLLDWFGSISSLARATAADILDVTVLSAASAHAIEEFFRSEYALE
ncbi:hypothetical protein PybrP1_004773 [[Pythium] brassicae (nom. inval.)]|nr:hypothetical protein PybrP1_004773 [[Pythium] brassicae (nom. inval.)]